MMDTRPPITLIVRTGVLSQRNSMRSPRPTRPRSNERRPTCVCGTARTVCGETENGTATSCFWRVMTLNRSDCDVTPFKEVD